VCGLFHDLRCGYGDHATAATRPTSDRRRLPTILNLFVGCIRITPDIVVVSDQDCQLVTADRDLTFAHSRKTAEIDDDIDARSAATEDRDGGLLAEA
jgi:hypothetical protein